MVRSFVVACILFLLYLPGQAQETKTLKEVTVTGIKQPFQRQNGALVVTVSGNPNFKTAANTLDILKKLPGLEVTSEGTLLLQGRITPGVFVDGKPLVMSPEELQNYLLTLTPT